MPSQLSLLGATAAARPAHSRPLQRALGCVGRRSRSGRDLWSGFPLRTGVRFPSELATNLTFVRNSRKIWPEYKPTYSETYGLLAVPGIDCRSPYISRYTVIRLKIVWNIVGLFVIVCHIV